MSEETHDSSDMDMVVELPPVLVQFLDAVRADQKRLMKDRKTFANADELRKFLSLNVMERFIQAVEMLGTTALDIHQLSVSNATQLQRMRRWTAKHLRKLGAEVSDGEAFAGVGTEQIDALGQALYALGSHLQAKYPNDKDTEVKFNAFALAYNQLVEVLMGNQGIDEDEEDDDEDEEDEGAENDESGDAPASTEEPVDGGEGGDAL